MKHTPFLWPDHVIGKRESRAIREAQNALYNSHAELLAALQGVVYWFDVVGTERGSATMARFEQARVAIAKAIQS